MQTRSTIVDIKKLEIPVQEFKTPKQIFVKQIKENTPSATISEITVQWHNLPEKERQKYEKQFEKIDAEFRKKLQEFQEKKTGQKAVPIPPVPKPKQPATAYNRWISQNSEQLKKDYQAQNFQKRQQKFYYRFQAKVWDSLSETGKRPFFEAYKKEKLIYDKKLKEWNEKYGDEEDESQKIEKKKKKSSKGKTTPKKSQKINKKVSIVAPRRSSRLSNKPE